MNRLTQFSLLSLALALVAGCSSGTPSPEPAPKTAEEPKIDAKVSEPTKSGTEAPKTEPQPETGPSKEAGKSPLPNMPKPPVLVDNIPRANSEGWTRVAVSPLEVAKLVDRRLNEMRTLQGGFRFALDLPQGRASGESLMSVKNNTTWRMQLPKLLNEELGVSYEIVVADGKRYASIADKGWSAPKPVASRQTFKADDIVKRWPSEMMSLAFAGMGNNSNPWSTYIAQVNKPGTGLTSRVDQRVISFDGRPIEQLRILVERNPAEAKKKGVLVVEMVLDKKIAIPFSMRSAVHNPGKKPHLVNWTAEWRSQKEFAADAFKTPDKAMPPQIIK